MIEGHIDSSFTTEQRDLFASGIVADIGVNAYAVWSAIKFYADYNTGHAWPGMRTLGQKLGLSAATVKRAIDTLGKASMVRVVASSTRRKGQTYIAREKMAVRLGNRVLCTIVIDYVPGTLRGKINRLESALCAQTDPEAFFPEKGGSTREAKKVCTGCEVRAECLEYALANDERFGIWGGLSERERRKLKKRAV